MGDTVSLSLATSQDSLFQKRTLYPADQRQAGCVCRDGTWYWDFSTNDYLGLASAPEMTSVVQAAIQNYGFGATGSRLLSGHSVIYDQLESRLAALFSRESSLVFNSGYQGNLAILSGLLGSQDVVFADKLCHASWIDAVRLSGASLIRYRHQDIGHLERLLQQKRVGFDGALILTESVFSMDGDVSQIAPLVNLKRQYNTQLLVDEAHGFGVLGPSGLGQCALEGCVSDVDYLVGTFGKSCGGMGGFLVCDAAVRDCLIQSSRPFIYSTALPPAVMAWNLKAIEMLQEMDEARQSLLSQAAYFRNGLLERGYETMGESPIIPLILGSNQAVCELSDRLKEKGFWVPAIRTPTVPKGRERLRFSLCVAHEKVVLDEVLDVLS